MSHKAKRLLVHYFQAVWEKAGLRWDSDNVAEVEAIVDELLEAAAEAGADESDARQKQREEDHAEFEHRRRGGGR